MSSVREVWPDDICTCACHDQPINIRQCFACCERCNLCGERIRTIQHDDHWRQCTAEKEPERG